MWYSHRIQCKGFCGITSVIGVKITQPRRFYIVYSMAQIIYRERSLMSSAVCIIWTFICKYPQFSYSVINPLCSSTLHRYAECGVNGTICGHINFRVTLFNGCSHKVVVKVCPNHVNITMYLYLYLMFLYYKWIGYLGIDQHWLTDL